jgi:hypothetical protein
VNFFKGVFGRFGGSVFFGVGFFVCGGHSDLQHSHLKVYFIYGMFISIFTLHYNTGIIIMNISKSVLKRFLTSIVFIYTFGFANQNQIEQLLKTVDKNKNLTGFIPLIEKQSQNSFRHTGISSPITVHNSRDDFMSVLIDSSSNGYSFISDVTDPLSWAPSVPSLWDDEDAPGFLLTYRQFLPGANSNGFIGAAQSADGEEWYSFQGLNMEYGDYESPNLPTYNGQPQGRYPSASIINSTPVIFWNEFTNTNYGGGQSGGYPLYIYNSLGMDDPEEAYWPFTSPINTGCSTNPCDPADLWLPQIQSVQDDGGTPTMGMLFQQSTSGFMDEPTGSYLPIPDRFYWISSSFFYNGWFLWNNPELLFDFSDNEIISEYAGRPRFHINDNGVGYFVFSGYGEGYDSEGSLQSHTFFILKTTNYGETWEPIGETFNNGSFGFISDDNLNQSMLDAGLLGGTVQDSEGNDVTLDQAFMGYHYQVFTDEYNELHIITTALPKNSESDSLYVGSPGAGYYHLHNSIPSNPGNWNATMIRDMSDSYKVQIHPSIPTWQYLYADIAVSYTGETIWTVTSAIRELIPLGNNEYTYDDLDLFGSVSLDNGVNWGDLGNLTDTPSGGANGLNVELHPHLAPLADIGECFLTFQMPVFEDDEYDMVMNRIYFAKIGLESLSGGGTVKINEIMQNPFAVADDSGEWFEIINDGNLPINLFGCSIKDAGDDMHTIEDAIVLFPGQFKVFGNNSNPDANGGVTVDYQYSDVSLGNSSDELIILDRDGMVIDSVAYDGGPDNDGGIFPDPNGASMALVHPDSNNNVGTNWQESTTSYGDGDLGTPGIPNFSSDIALDLTSLDFDTVNVGESGTLDLTISNAGNESLQLDSLYTNSTLFTLSFTDSLVETSAVLQITFTPTEFGPDTATLYIESNDPDEGIVEVLLTGFGYYPSPDIELESTSIDFGGVMDGLSITQSLEIYNTGDAGLELDTMYCTGNFSVMPSNGTVNIGDTLAIEVTFSPDDETSFAGTMTIVAGNDPDEDTLTVSLSGNGTPQAAIISSDQDTVSFGEVGEGQTSNQSIIIRNIGMVDLEVEEISFSGGDTSLFSTTFSDATIEAGDSVVVPILFTNQSNTQIYVETMSIISNDSYTGTLNILLVVGLNQIIVQELFYDDGTAETHLELGEGNMAANRFMSSMSVYLWSVKYYFVAGGQIDIVIWDSGENNLPYNELVRINNVEVQPGWFEYDLTYLNIPSGEFFVGYVDLSESPAIGIDANTTPENSYIDIGNSWEPLGNFFEGSWMIRAIVFIGPENIPPDNFSLTEPTNNAQITINDSNMVDGFITFSWDESSDENGDSLVYLMHATSTDLEDFSLVTNITSIDMPYMEIVDEMSENNITSATIEWTVDVTDGIDTVTANNAPFTLIVDGSDALSALAEKLIPEVFALHQNYPNPFNPTTQIKYDLPEDALVAINIYDLMGRSIKSLVNSNQSAGYRSIQWNATNNLGEPVSAGMYLYTIQAGEFTQTKKMVLLK